MSALDKTEYELAALVFLLQAFPSFIKDPVKGEKPDWQDSKHGIGIEVTIAQTQHMGYTTHFFNRYHGMHKSEIPQKELEGFQGQVDFDDDDRLVVVSESRGSTDRSQNIDRAMKQTIKKLERLSATDFQSFDQNVLFLFLLGTVLEEDAQWFLGEYHEVVRAFAIPYSDVFLMDFNSITLIDLLGMEIIRREFSDREMDELQGRVHLLRSGNDWKDGTRFFDVYSSESDSPSDKKEPK